jgi:transcriptional regulator with XRE-family HTH domain
MNNQPAQDLARLLRDARLQLGISARELARQSGVTVSTISRLENGDIPQPRTDKLRPLADTLKLELADLYAAIGYEQPTALPSFTPYLRSKYADLPDTAKRELESAFDRIAKKHGYSSTGPNPGEDEI